MSKEKKSPIIAGVINMLIPGGGHFYVNNDRNKFVKTFAGSVLLITAMPYRTSVATPCHRIFAWAASC